MGEAIEVGVPSGIQLEGVVVAGGRVGQHPHLDAPLGRLVLVVLLEGQPTSEGHHARETTTLVLCQRAHLVLVIAGVVSRRNYTLVAVVQILGDLMVSAVSEDAGNSRHRQQPRLAVGVVLSHRLQLTRRRTG